LSRVTYSGDIKSECLTPKRSSMTPSGTVVVVLSAIICRGWPRLRIVDVVPKHRWMVALDELPHLRVSVFAISLALRLHRFIISGNTDRTGTNVSRSRRSSRAHAQTLFADGSSQLTNEITCSMLPFGW